MNDIKFTIITPWLPPRETILRSIACVQSQTYPNWQHLVQVDDAPENVPQNLVDQFTKDERRSINYCGVWHHLWGNPCRAKAYDQALGDWILYLDDDDILRPNALEEIAKAIQNEPTKEWGYFKILSGGRLFPQEHGLRHGNITGGQVFHKRIISGVNVRWAEEDIHGADWELVRTYLLNYEPILIDEILGDLPKYHWGAKYTNQP